MKNLGAARVREVDITHNSYPNRDLRLNVFPIYIPALRERAEDIPPLARHYVRHFSSRLGKTIDTIPAETMDALVQYPWPGNVRELQNVLERASILAPDQVLRISSEDLSMPGHAHPPQTDRSGHSRTALDAAERERIVAALEEANWIVAGPKGAAAHLGIKRSTLQSRMQKLGIHVLGRGPKRADAGRQVSGNCRPLPSPAQQEPRIPLNSLMLPLGTRFAFIGA